MVALLFEWRDGPTLMWVRRFQRVGGDRAQWIDDVGFIRGTGDPVGWFGEE